jgi:hypothetical protein
LNVKLVDASRNQKVKDDIGNIPEELDFNFKLIQGIKNAFQTK